MMMDERDRGPRLEWLVVPAAALAWVSATGFQLWDAGELSAAAWRLGGSHSPGQPLHALMGHLFALVPLGPIEYRIALVSVVSEVGAAAFAACITGWLVRGLCADGAGSRAGRWVGRLAPHAAALACLLSPTFLREAARPECYGLAVFCSLASVYALLRWLDGSAGHLRVAALWAGLAVTAHPPEALTPLVVGALLAVFLRRDVLRFRPIAWAAIACVLGLTVFAYLPVRAVAGAPTWGDPQTLHGFIAYVTGAPYITGDAHPRTVKLAQMLTGLKTTVLAAGVVPLVGALIALFVPSRRRGSSGERPARAASALLVLTSLGVSAATWVMPLPSLINTADQPAYFAPATALLVAVGAAGLAMLGVSLSSGEERRAAPGWQVALGALGLAVLAVNVPNIAEARMRTDASSLAIDTLGLSILASPPPRSLAITHWDFSIFTAFDGQDIEGARPDVAFFPNGLAGTPFAWRRLAPHPLYTGRPFRAENIPQLSLKDQFVGGAIALAQHKVPILFEPPNIFAPSGAPVSGIFTVLWPGRRAPSSDPSFGERLLPYIAEAGKRYPLGDEDAGGAELRRVFLDRAQAMLMRRDYAGATEQFRAALWFLPPKLLELIEIPGPPVAPRAKIVFTNSYFVYGMTRGDTIRALSVVLASSGAEPAAVALLKAQIAEGDEASQRQLDAIEAVTAN